jgi:hypothetical protein
VAKQPNVRNATNGNGKLSNPWPSVAHEHSSFFLTRERHRFQMQPPFGAPQGYPPQQGYPGQMPFPGAMPFPGGPAMAPFGMAAPVMPSMPPPPALVRQVMTADIGEEISTCDWSMETRFGPGLLSRLDFGPILVNASPDSCCAVSLFDSDAFYFTFALSI